MLIEGEAYVWLLIGGSIAVIAVYIVIHWWLLKRKWNYIETVNQPVGITRANAYLDPRGYLRWKGDKKLCHRDIAYRNLNQPGVKFGNMDVHHRNGDKLNDTPENLQILGREDHQIEHGQILYESGKKYVRVCRRKRVTHQTKKAFLFGRVWYPRSQTLVRDQYLYVAEWIFKKKNN